MLLTKCTNNKHTLFNPANITFQRPRLVCVNLEQKSRYYSRIDCIVLMVRCHYMSLHAMIRIYSSRKDDEGFVCKRDKHKIWWSFRSRPILCLMTCRKRINRFATSVEMTINIASGGAKKEPSGVTIGVSVTNRDHLPQINASSAMVVHATLLIS